MFQQGSTGSRMPLAGSSVPDAPSAVQSPPPMRRKHHCARRGGPTVHSHTQGPRPHWEPNLRLFAIERWNLLESTRKVRNLTTLPRFFKEALSDAFRIFFGIPVLEHIASKKKQGIFGARSLYRRRQHHPFLLPCCAASFSDHLFDATFKSNIAGSVIQHLGIPVLGSS